MIAPSEKHLEDWIVANPSGFLPRFWWEHKTDTYTPMIERIVARQPRFPWGRPDLIAISAGGVELAVIELKKDVIASETVTQVMRYMRDLDGIWMSAHIQECVGKVFSPYRNVSAFGVQDRAITGYVVGHCVPDRNLLVLGELFNINFVLYEFDGTDYTFIHTGNSREELDKDSAHHDWANGAIGKAIREVMLRRSIAGKQIDLRIETEALEQLMGGDK